MMYSIADVLIQTSSYDKEWTSYFLLSFMAFMQYGSVSDEFELVYYALPSYP
jgi:hypothetical protein